MDNPYPSGKRFIVFDDETSTYHAVVTFAEYNHSKGAKLPEEQAEGLRAIIKTFEHGKKLQAIEVKDPKVYEAIGTYAGPPH